MPGIDIAALMAPLGPFERPPVIAAAVSGGSDSLGLGLMLSDWVSGQGGRLYVLTVDHGLRPESAAECAHVATTFDALPSASAHILRWTGEKPARGLQAAARAARYALLAEWCRAHGVVHLAVAHTADDQAETVAMREAHSSGPAGLSGMSAVRPLEGLRLLRPLLPVSRAVIRAWLEARGQEWIEDPSNALTEFERVRIRQSLDPQTSGEVVALAAQHGRSRDTLERQAARLVSEAGQVHEAGYASVGLAPLRDASRALQETILRQLILAVGSADYAPDLDGFLEALALAEPPARTLGGCLVQCLQGRLHVFREAAAIGVPVAVGPGWHGPWDGRFALRVTEALGQDHNPGQEWTIGPFGEAGGRQAVDRFGTRLKRHPIPLPARLALPALWQGEHLVAQPHLHLGEGLVAQPAPRHTVTTCGFTVAVGPPHTIYSPAPC